MIEQPSPQSRPRLLRKCVILHSQPGEMRRSFRSPVWEEWNWVQMGYARDWLEDRLREEEQMGRSRVVVAEWLEEVNL